MSAEVQRTPLSEDHAALISDLVSTYRELNMHVRPLEEDKLAAGGENSARAIIKRLSHDEILFAQALKEHITGVATTSAEDDAPIIGTEGEDDTTRMLISQFGTARATTLTLLKDLTNEDWTAKAEDGQSILEHVQELAASDKTQLERIRQAIA